MNAGRFISNFFIASSVNGLDIDNSSQERLSRWRHPQQLPILIIRQQPN